MKPFHKKVECLMLILQQKILMLSQYYVGCRISYKQDTSNKKGNR